MKENLQNRISKALNQGIQLGFDLCDISLDDDTRLDKDLQHYEKQFKSHGFQEVLCFAIELMLQDEVDDNVYDILSKVCREFDEKYDHIYKVNDPQELHDLIDHLTMWMGRTINLNWIDVSELDEMCFSSPDVFDGVSYGIFTRTNFDGDISRWDVSHCHSMKYMFSSSQFRGDISKWNVANVCDMSYMFASSKFNGDISRWDVSRVKNMNFMFYDSKFNQDISQWKVDECEYVHSMFTYSKFKQDLSSWNLLKVSNMTNFDIQLAFYDFPQESLPRFI